MARRDDRPRGAPASPAAAVAPSSPRVVALCRIRAGAEGTYLPGAEFPAHLTDGLTEGVHYREAT